MNDVIQFDYDELVAYLRRYIDPSMVDDAIAELKAPLAIRYSSSNNSIIRLGKDICPDANTTVIISRINSAHQLTIDGGTPIPISGKVPPKNG